MSVAAVLANGLDLKVDRVERHSGNAASIVLTRPDRGELPGYVPGSHLLVDCITKVNAYSLTGDGQFPREYAITVQLDEAGAGGSMRMHQLVPGATLRVSYPRSAFAPVSNARHHVLVAAGIGLTPVLSHARSAALWGRSTSVLYVHRESSPVHVDALDELRSQSPHIDVRTFTSRTAFTDALPEVLRTSPIGSHLYVCGPPSFMDAVLETASDMGWPTARLHSESFGLSSLDPGEPFAVRVAGIDQTIDVPSGVSLLEALESAGLGVPNMCRQGVCGECRLRVTAGTPLHRDLYLDEEEKASNDVIMACVSRSVHAELGVAL